MNAVDALIQVRLLVAFLGEKENFGWWNTSFLGATGRRYLAFNFPRSALAAGLRAATEAAAGIHDERIGRGRVNHLFRLPLNVEEEMHPVPAREAARESLAALVADRDTATEALRRIADGGPVASEGPFLAGGKADLTGKNIPRNLAAYYLSAFTGGIQTFPYYQG